jgi:hypothetical protein
MAFSAWIKAIVAIGVNLPLMWFVEYTGLRRIWRKCVTDHKTLVRLYWKGLEHINERPQRREREAKEKEAKDKEAKEKRGGGSRGTGGVLGKKESYESGNRNVKVNQNGSVTEVGSTVV